MPKTRSQIIRDYLTRKGGYYDLSNQDLAFADEVEEKLNTFHGDDAAKDQYYATVRERYEMIKQVKDENRVTSASELNSAERYVNLDNSLKIISGMERRYRKINPVNRFFSHFVPNSWTKAGRMRDEIKSCTDVMKEVGVTQKMVEDYYTQAWNSLGDGAGEDLMKAHVVTKAFHNNLLKKSAMKEIHEYAERNMIADPVDLSHSHLESDEPDEEEENDREPMEVPETQDNELEDDEPETDNLDNVLVIKAEKNETTQNDKNDDFSPEP